MPAFSDQTTNFLHGLSDLWNRFFRDRDQLEAVYKANEILIGQTYLDLMETVLNLSIREAPVFGKDFFRLLTVREDLITKRLDGRYSFDLTPYGIKSFVFLQNKILDPTTILEYDLDFVIDLTGEEDLLLFHKNPFDWDNDGSNQVVPGVAFRTVEVTQDDGTVARERELAFWIPDCQKDSFNLYLNFGYLIQRFEPSSEAYRALIQGVTRYFVLGPTANILVSSLNVVVGAPVIRDDGEYLLRVESDSELQTVVTNARSYEFDARLPLRDDVLDPDNWADNVGADAALAFNSFEHLTKLFQVFDAVNNWSWWFEKEIPSIILPDEPKGRRLISPALFENLVDNPTGLVKVGDPGVFIGADDDGFVPTGRPSYRHLFSYLVFERFLRYHTFVMEIDKDALIQGILPFSRLNSDLQSIVLAGKSAYTFLFTEQDLPLFDDIIPIDYLMNIISSLELGDETNSVQMAEPIFDDGLFVGDYYYYSGGSLLIDNPWPGWTDEGKMPVVAGGVDPRMFVGSEIVDGESKHGDWPVEIKVATP